MISVFLSYAREDRDRCDEIYIAIEQTFPAWYDKRIPGGQNWWNTVLNQVDSHEVFMYLLSDQSLTSLWCIREYEIARKLNRLILPVIVSRIEPSHSERNPLRQILEDRIQILDLSDKGKSDKSRELLTALINLERGFESNTLLSLEDLAPEDLLPPKIKKHAESTHKVQPRTANPILDYDSYLLKVGCATQTQRAYHRWLDRFLVEMMGFEEIPANQRKRRNRGIIAEDVQNVFSVQSVKSWFQSLELDDYSAESFAQARMAIEHFATLAHESGVLDRGDFLEMYYFLEKHSPRFAKARSQRVLREGEVSTLLQTPERMPLSENQRRRNTLVLNFLYQMAMRRSELAELVWIDVVWDQRGVLRLHRYPEKKKRHFSEVTGQLPGLIEEWKELIAGQNGTPPAMESRVMRRVWRGGRIDDRGLTADAIWRITERAGEVAGIGCVSPDDLRRSRLIHLHQEGIPMSQISRLAGHNDMAITARYIGKSEDLN